MEFLPGLYSLKTQHIPWNNTDQLMNKVWQSSFCLAPEQQHVHGKKWLNDGSVVQSYPLATH